MSYFYISLLIVVASNEFAMDYLMIGCTTNTVTKIVNRSVSKSCTDVELFCQLPSRSCAAAATSVCGVGVTVHTVDSSPVQVGWFKIELKGENFPMFFQIDHWRTPHHCTSSG